MGDARRPQVSAAPTREALADLLVKVAELADVQRSALAAQMNVVILLRKIVEGEEWERGLVLADIEAQLATAHRELDVAWDGLGALARRFGGQDDA